MPLPLAFASNPSVGKKKLSSIREDPAERNDDDSTDDVLSILRRRSSNPSHVNNDTNTKAKVISKQDDASSRLPISRPTSNVTSSELSQLSQSIKQILEVQQKQNRMISQNEERSKQSQEELSALRCLVDGVSKSIDVLVDSVAEGQEDLAEISNSMSILVKELSTSNAEHIEAMTNLKVRSATMSQ